MGHKNRDNRHSFQSQCDFLPNVILWIVEAAPVSIVFSVEPFSANYRDREFAIFERRFELLRKLRSHWNVVNVPKNDPGAKVHIQVMVNATSRILAIFTPV